MNTFYIKKLCFVVIFWAFQVSAYGVTCALWNQTQFSNASGAPLSGGLIAVTQGGTTINQTSYTSKTCATPASNPVVLTAGGYGELWLDTTKVYRLTIRTSGGSLIQTLDGVQIGGGGSGGGGQWTTSGNDIYNNNSGKVLVGTSSGPEKLSVLGNENVQGTLYVQNSDTTPRRVGLIAPTGMAGDISLTLPTALPGSTSCIQSSTSGILSFVTCGGGGGGGGGATSNVSCSSAMAVTTLACDITALGLTSVNSTLTGCWSGTSTFTPLANTFATTGTSPITTVTFTFASTANVRCTVNSSGDASIWSRDTNSNITLSDSLTAVSVLKLQNQTPATGETKLTVFAGAGQPTYMSTMVEYYDSTSTLVGYVNAAGDSVMTSLGSLAGEVTIRSTGVGFGSPSTIYWTSGAHWYDGTADLGLSRESAGLLKVSDTMGNARDLHIRNLTIDGTCTGSACTGGGSSLPVIDSTSLIYKSGDVTAQVRLSASLVSTSTIRALTAQDASYVIAGTNIVNTFSGNNIFTAPQTFQDAVVYQQGGLTRFATNTGSSGASWDFYRYDNSGVAAGIPISIARATGNITVSGNILPNGTLTIGSSLASNFSEGWFGAMHAQSVQIYGGASSTTLYTMGLSSGLLSIADSLTNALVTVASGGGASLAQWKFYGDVLPSVAAGKTLGNGSFQWDGNFRNITITGTCTGAGCGGGGSGANTSLSNLASVAINTSLISDTDLADDLGTTAKRWKTIEGQTIITRNGGAGAAGSGLGQISSSGLTFKDSTGATALEFSVLTGVLRNNNTTPLTIGPQDSQSLIFQTANTQRMQVTNTGNLLLHKTTGGGISAALLQIDGSTTNPAVNISVDNAFDAVTITGTSNAGGLLNITSGSTTLTPLGVYSGARTVAAAAFGVGSIFNACGLFTGAGSPEGAVTSGVCGIYLRTNGGAGTTLYIKESGSGSTGWVGK